MNGQAGQNIPKRYNMGGGEVMGTYWLRQKLGVVGRLSGWKRVLRPCFLIRLLTTAFWCIRTSFSGGVQYRGPRRIDTQLSTFMRSPGASHGTFDNAVAKLPWVSARISATGLGLYTNHTTGMGRSGWQHRFQLLCQSCNSAVTGHDFRAFRYRDPGVRRRYRWVPCTVSERR